MKRHTCVSETTYRCSEGSIALPSNQSQLADPYTLGEMRDQRPALAHGQDHSRGTRPALGAGTHPPNARLHFRLQNSGGLRSDHLGVLNDSSHTSFSRQSDRVSPPNTSRRGSAGQAPKQAGAIRRQGTATLCQHAICIEPRPTCCDLPDLNNLGLVCIMLLQPFFPGPRPPPPPPPASYTHKHTQRGHTCTDLHSTPTNPHPPVALGGVYCTYEYRKRGSGEAPDWSTCRHVCVRMLKAHRSSMGRDSSYVGPERPPAARADAAAKRGGVRESCKLICTSRLCAAP